MKSSELEDRVRTNFAEARRHLRSWKQMPVGSRKSDLSKAHCENAIVSLVAIVDMLSPPSAPSPPFPKKFDEASDAVVGAYKWAHIAEWCCEQSGLDMSAEVPKYDLVGRPAWLK